MKIELKNIHYSVALSEETHAFTANLYVNGAHVGYAKNDGQGGNTFYHAKDPDSRKIVNEAEAYCQSLPPETYPGVMAGKESLVKNVTLESYIDDLMEAYVKKRDQAKVERMERNNVIFGNLDFGMAGYVRTGIPLAEMLKTTGGRQRLLSIIQKTILPELKPGITILNQNIPEELLIEAGLKKEQYLSPKSTANKSQQNQRSGRQQQRKPK